MKSDKALYIIFIIILLLHHCKDLLREKMISDIAQDNYKLEALLLHSKLVVNNIDEEFDKLEMNPVKIFRVYSIGMLVAMGMPIIIPFIRLL